MIRLNILIPSEYKKITSYRWTGFTVECVIMAPSTMISSPKDKTQKSDPMDTRQIAQCLCYGQYSSDSTHFGAMTKAGTAHLRRLLIEATSCYNCGFAGKKYKLLKNRQSGNNPEVIAYADKGCERLRRKDFHLTLNGRKPANVAKTAVARELAHFIWGMMNGRIA